MLTLIAGVVGEVELACDAVDEAFARAFERWERVSAMGHPAGWVYRVALNAAKRRARRRTFERRVLGRVDEPVMPGPTGELWLVVAALPERQRVAVLLRHVGQLTEAEIAEVMGVRRGTVSSTLRAAYRRLGAELHDDSILGEVVDARTR